jgi:hypothetical protein
MALSLAQKSTTKMALLAAVMVPVVTANAAIIIFTFDGTEGATSYSKTVSGVTLTLTNPVESDGVFAFGNVGAGSGDLNLSNVGVYVSSFNFKFSSDVTVTGYNISQIDGTPSGTFSLSAPGATTSSGNSLATTGDNSVSGTFSIAANTIGTFDSTIPAGTYIAMHSITVTTVPEPGEWATITATGCGLAALLLRRRK